MRRGFPCELYVQYRFAGVQDVPDLRLRPIREFGQDLADRPADVRRCRDAVDLGQALVDPQITQIGREHRQPHWGGGVDRLQRVEVRARLALRLRQRHLRPLAVGDVLVRADQAQELARRIAFDLAGGGDPAGFAVPAHYPVFVLVARYARGQRLTQCGVGAGAVVRMQAGHPGLVRLPAQAWRQRVQRAVLRGTPCQEGRIAQIHHEAADAPDALHAGEFLLPRRQRRGQVARGRAAGCVRPNVSRPVFGHVLDECHEMVRRPVGVPRQRHREAAPRHRAVAAQVAFLQGVGFGAAGQQVVDQSQVGREVGGMGDVLEAQAQQDLTRAVQEAAQPVVDPREGAAERDVRHADRRLLERCVQRRLGSLLRGDEARDAREAQRPSGRVAFQLGQVMHPFDRAVGAEQAELEVVGRLPPCGGGDRAHQPVAVGRMHGVGEVLGQAGLSGAEFPFPRHRAGRRERPFQPVPGPFRPRVVRRRGEQRQPVLAVGESGHAGAGPVCRGGDPGTRRRVRPRPGRSGGALSRTPNPGSRRGSGRSNIMRIAFYSNTQPRTVATGV